MKKRKIKWTTVFFATIICTSFYGVALANLTVRDITIPSQYGMIKESFNVPSIGQSANPIIIHIQDAHCNYEAQKNMSKMLDYLVKEYSLRLIMVEGGSGDVSLSFLRSYADKDSRAEVADRYLKEGRISGEEYLNITSEYPLELYGIEDQELYDAHMSAFQKLDSFREKGTNDLKRLADIANSLKPFIYNEWLKELEANKAKYEDKTLSLPDYCRHLRDVAKKTMIGLEDYPHLVSFCDVARLEKEMDLQQVESQRDAFIRELVRFLDEKEMQNFITMTKGFKAKMITSERYYSFLRDIAEGKLEIEYKYPQLYSYIYYITTSKDVDASVLLKEMGNIEDKIENALFSNFEQRRLAEIVKFIQILTKALNMELTPEDYEYFQANRDKLSTSSWIDFLVQNCDKYNISIKPSASNIIDQNLQELERFYKIGVEREKAFIRNMVSKLNMSKERTAVLITGGFHTQVSRVCYRMKGIPTRWLLRSSLNRVTPVFIFRY